MGGQRLAMLASDTPGLNYRAMFEAAPRAYLVLAPDLTVAAANNAYLAMTMTERGALVGRNMLEVFAANPDDPDADGREALRASVRRVLEHKRADAMPILKHDIPCPEHLGGGYEPRYWRATNSPVLDGDGTVRWIVHQADDVTELVAQRSATDAGDERAMDELRVLNQLHTANRDLAARDGENRRLQSAHMNLAGIVESSEDAIISKTLDGHITSWNDAAERLFGYTAEEMIGQPVLRLFPSDLSTEEDEIMARLRAGERVAHYETRRRRKDGSDIHVSLSISPLHDGEGRIVGASKIVRDISQRKEAEDRLADLQAELVSMSRWHTFGIMAASIAHDLNQPLAASNNYLAALRRVIAAPKPNLELADEIIGKAAQQSRRAGEIVQHLRRFVSKGEPERKPEDLATVAAEAIALSRFATKQHRVQASVEAAAGLPPVPVDKIQLQQVLVNLLRNAAEAMRDSPTREITIRIRPPGEDGMVQIDVADTGPGLAEDIAKNLFQPFATTKKDGMGLGLSICREIVSAHGGRLWASANIPCGTVFSLTLPLAAQDDAA